ncbi:MAG: 5-aminolevulic acid synthase [Pseudomonadota bacterium]
MTERDPDLLRTVAEALIYYAAIAAAPDEGIFSPATLGAANHHRMEDAEVAAKAACDAAKNSEAACVVVTRIRPRGWSPKSLQLSHDATTVFRKEFRRANGPKAFAVARGASRYGYSVSASSVSVAEQQALESCGDPACAIVILGE